MDLSQVSTEELMKMRAAPRLDLSNVSTEDLMKMRAKPDRSLLDQVGRQVGLTARAGAMGITFPARIVGDALGLHTSEAMGGLLDKFLPSPENATERVVQDVAGSMAGAGGQIKVADLIAKGVAPGAARLIAEQFAQGPGLQIASAGSASGAGGAVRESGGSPTAQTVATLVGGMTPAALQAGGSMAVRGLLRGGEEGRLKTAENIGTFNDAGTTPTVGQATETRASRLAETMLSKTPGSAGVMAKKATTQADELSGRVGELADQLSTKTGAAPAGRAIKEGVIADGGFREYFKARQGALYDNLDKYIPKDSRVDIANTKNALEELNASIPGAPNTSKFFQNSKIGGIEGALKADTETPAGVLSQLGPIQKALLEETPAAQRNAIAAEFMDGKLPYEAVKKLRTLVGKEMADSSIVSDVPRSKWTALYGALSKDLGGAAEQAGPDAVSAWQRANTFTAAGMKRLETLDPILGTKDPEDIFKAATSGMQEGATTIRAVMRSLPEPAQKQVAATVLKRMGIAAAGKQDATGEVFSPETFLTNWNKIGPDAKQALFSKYGPDYTRNLDQVAKVASNLREGSKIFANPSGTEAALTSKLGIAGVIYGLLFGHPTAALTLGGGMVGAQVGAKKLMTNPEFVKWLAETTTVPKGTLASQAIALERLADKQPSDQGRAMKDFAATIKKQAAPIGQ